MKKLNQSNIVRLYEIIDDPDSDKLYLIMPVADYGELLQWDGEKMAFAPNHKLLARNNSKAHKLKPLDTRFYSEDFIKKTATKLLDALDYLHCELNIVHRDIKP